MNTYIEAPQPVEFHKIKDWQRAVFLGGSITGAIDWQKPAKDKLLPYFTVVNPRRFNYDSFDSSQERIQITWEYNMIEACGIILFYFSNETFAPITLFELGKVLRQAKYAPWKKVYISIHPEYKRKNDVIIQTELESLEFAKKITFDLGETLDMIVKENK